MIVDVKKTTNLLNQTTLQECLKNLMLVKKSQLFEIPHSYSLGEQIKVDWNMKEPQQLPNQEKIQDSKLIVIVFSGKNITKEEIKKKI